MDVNLLPYREKERQANKRLMTTTLSICFLCLLIIGFIIHRSYSVEINAQTHINNTLHTAGSAVLPEMNKLANIEKDRSRIAEKVKTLLDLEARRYQAVKLLNIITEITPRGVTYNEIDRKEEEVNLIGEAEKKQDVANLLKKIDENTMFFNAGLSEVISASTKTQNNTILIPQSKPEEKNNDSGKKLVNFKLNFRLVEKKLVAPVEKKTNPPVKAKSPPNKKKRK